MSGLKTVAMTTNGLTLSRKLPALVEAGLDALNIRSVQGRFKRRVIN